MSETLKNNEQEAEQQTTGWENMDEYRKVDTKEYVEQGLADGSLEVFEAAKHARIGAVKGEVGQEVISWSEDENGNPIQEKVATVTADEATGETGWIATKTDAEGNPIVDKNGNLNQWIIDDATFKKKYEVDPKHPDIFQPVGGPQKFVQTRENLTISQWGDEMNMPRGSYINITNPDDMYAINPRDFEDTYTKTEAEAEVASEKSVDHRGREYINLDEIDITTESGQMEYAECYINNALNHAMTAIEDKYGDNVNFEDYYTDGAWRTDSELIKDYSIAKAGQEILDEIRDDYLSAAAMGEPEPYESVLDEIKRREKNYMAGANYRAYDLETKASAAERLREVLEERLKAAQSEQ